MDMTSFCLPDNATATELHRAAMALCDDADLALADHDRQGASMALVRALVLEQRAAELTDSEPSRSVLLSSMDAIAGQMWGLVASFGAPSLMRPPTLRQTELYACRRGDLVLCEDSQAFRVGGLANGHSHRWLRSLREPREHRLVHVSTVVHMVHA